MLSMFPVYSTPNFFFFSTDIRLDWQTFNEDNSNRRHLLDFVVSFGDQFPLKDANGAEIVPEEVEGT